MMPFKPILMSLEIIFTLWFSLKSPKIEIMLCNEKISCSRLSKIGANKKEDFGLGLLVGSQATRS